MACVIRARINSSVVVVVIVAEFISATKDQLVSEKNFYKGGERINSIALPRRLKPNATQQLV